MKEFSDKIPLLTSDVGESRRAEVNEQLDPEPGAPTAREYRELA
jgi:hypothetical protein